MRAITVNLQRNLICVVTYTAEGPGRQVARFPDYLPDLQADLIEFDGRLAGSEDKGVPCRRIDHTADRTRSRSVRQTEGGSRWVHPLPVS